MRIGMGLAGAAALMMASVPMQALAGGPPPQGYVGDPVTADETGYGRGPAYAGEAVRADQSQESGYQQHGQWSAGEQHERREYRQERSEQLYGEDSRYSGSGGYRYEHREQWGDDEGQSDAWASDAGGYTNGYSARFSYQSGGWTSGGYIEPCNPRLRDAYGRSADCPGELSLRDSFFAYGETSVGPTWLGAPGGGGGGGGGFAEAGSSASAGASASASASVRISIRGGGHGGHGGPPPHGGGGCGCHH
jgi:hypothetical protein